ncbi:YkgJ family cysteine cluster protein [Salinirubellus salinus]|uniref:YkgJ family cysteine cluster protein n=1 Tax=Salinirubellus salinus TaxID=1364945 RepID=A0A9E7R114_9EURY|nr:YkgJ family cysteine cluster protein [Salinirubellus salinus]UWM53721.1 YkgJ family cysteine cluster protein [Salinirubellus salinus]
MEVNCEGCAGCCIDWRAVAPADVSLDHERRGPYRPLDDSYNLVPLSSDEVRAFVRDGLGDALTPRLWRGEGGPSVEVDGHSLAAVDGHPVFFVGLRKPPKPVAPFGLDPTWLPTCVFLDPTTLQCRIHGDDLYPDACARYPGDNLALDADTECERVERAFGGERLLDDTAGDATPLLAPSAVGGRLFAHPDHSRIEGRVARLARGTATHEDRAEFVAVAAGATPGRLDVDDDHYERAREAVLAADSWVGTAVEEWAARAETERPDPSLGAVVEEDHGAPTTPGWAGSREES